MNRKSLLATALACLVLAGCSSTGNQYSYSSSGPGYGAGHEAFSGYLDDRFDPQSTQYGKVVSEQPYMAANGRWCFDYQQTIFVHGPRYPAHGPACQDGNGGYKPIWTQF